MATTNNAPLTLISALDPSRHWLILGLTEEMNQRIEELSSQSGESRVDLIQSAIELYHTVLNARMAGHPVEIRASGEVTVSVAESNSSTNGTSADPASSTSNRISFEGPVAPPFRFDEHGRLLEFTEEELRQRHLAAKFLFDDLRSIPDDPSESNEEFFRAMDASRPDAPYFKGLY